MGNVLVICEKPSVAQSIAAVLSPQRASSSGAPTHVKKRQDGFLQGNGYIVSWCFGHLVELAAPAVYGEQYKRWSYNTLPILPERWQYVASKDKAKQLSVLRGLMNRADVESVVCATDAGREGELIFRLVYEHCKCNKPVQRLWISSMEDSAIREGFNGLRPGAEYDNLYHSALCRARADWLVGINATRLFSCLYGVTLNVGRVQSPTLALIVDREEAVLKFKPEPFFTPEINCGAFSASGEKLKDAQDAEAIRIACDGHDAVCLSVEKKEKTATPPKLYDLTTLQREANRLFGFTAQQTLDYTQSLYEKKLVTYPRTDSRFLTTDMAAGIPALVQAVTAVLPFSIKMMDSIDAGRVINDSKVTDHHAIIPTLSVSGFDLSAIPSGERSILHMLAVRLICATAPAHIFETVTADLECSGNRFTAKGRTVLRDGWKAIDGAFRSTLKNRPDEDGEEDGAALPELTKGQTFLSVSASVKEGKTTPPRRFTEDTLLSAMETAGADQRDAGPNSGFAGDESYEHRGLGTPATRAAIIEKLVKSGLVERQKKSLIPTDKGINLTAILPDEIKSPFLTAEWEQKLKLVERGELSESAFMDGIAVMTQELVKAHSAPIPEYKALFAVPTQNTDANRDGIIGQCPRCGSAVVERPKGFFCSSRDCSFALWKDNRFFTAKKKKLTKTVAAALLKEGRVFFSDLYSEKTGKTYAATVVLEDAGGRVNYKLEFDRRKN